MSVINRMWFEFDEDNLRDQPTFGAMASTSFASAATSAFSSLGWLSVAARIDRRSFIQIRPRAQSPEIQPDIPELGLPPPTHPRPPLSLEHIVGLAGTTMVGSVELLCGLSWWSDDGANGVYSLPSHP